MDYQSILQIATGIAHEAGALVRESFPRSALTRVKLKGAVDPVTETDTAAEALIIRRLREGFPDHRILAEETHGDDWRAWEEPGPPMWLYYFNVEDLDAAVEVVKAEGGKVLNGPMEVPGGDRIVQCMDPQGAMFALHAHEK